MHCHHEKTIVIDDRVAFVGGIDLTVAVGRPIRLRSITRPRNAIGLARRDRPDRGSGGRRRRRALPHALARGERRAARARLARPSRQATSSCRSYGQCRSASTPPFRAATSRILESYTRRSVVRERVHLPREPVPLVAGDRPLASRQARQPADPRLPGPRWCCRPARRAATTTHAASSPS